MVTKKTTITEYRLHSHMQVNMSTMLWLYRDDITWTLTEQTGTSLCNHLFSIIAYNCTALHKNPLSDYLCWEVPGALERKITTFLELSRFRQVQTKLERFEHLLHLKELASKASLTACKSYTHSFNRRARKRPLFLKGDSLFPKLSTFKTAKAKMLQGILRNFLFQNVPYNIMESKYKTKLILWPLSAFKMIFQTKVSLWHPPWKTCTAL